MALIRVHYVTKNLVRENRHLFFLVEDDLLGWDNWLLGEPNAIAIPVRKTPTSFFSDDEYEANVMVLDKALSRIPKGQHGMMSILGIGNNVGRLPTNAPRTYGYLQDRLHILER